MRLLVDVSGLMYRSAHTMDLTTPDGMQVGAVFGTLKSLERIAQATQATEVVVCWDGGSEKRKELYPEYKANREARKKKDPEFEVSFTRQKTVLHDVLQCLPVVEIYKRHVEADDTIAAIAKFLKHEHVGIVTGDTDLYQLADPPGHVIINSKGSVVDLEMTPHQYLAYKVMVGDTSDNIKGITRVGDKTARRLLAEHGTLASVLNAHKRSGDRLGSMLYPDAIKIVRRNLKLMRLNTLLSDEETKEVLDQYKRGRLERRTDEKALRARFTSLGFVSFLRRLSAFLIPFRRMERVTRRKHVEADNGDTGRKALPKDQSAGVRQASASGYAKRIRQPVEATAGRVEGEVQSGAARGGAGAGRASGRVGRATERRASKEEATDLTPTETPTALYPRVRAVALAGDDRERPDRGARGAVPASERKREGVAPRGSRTRRPLARLFESEKVAGKRRGRRQEAVHQLLTFNDKEGWDWLRGQPDPVLQFVSSLCDAINADKSYAPTASDLRLLAKIREDYLNEEPDWMRG